MSFSPRELNRYARQFSIPEFGIDGQRRLKSGSVLCIGAGGLGSPVLMYLAAAGVGRIGIVDADRVETSNLHRQLLYTEVDVGHLKAEAAKARITAMNPDIVVEAIAERFTTDNATDLVSRYDVIVDGSDNFATRYLSNDIAVWHRKPNIYGSILRFEGQATVFAPHLGGPCYRCFLPTPPGPGVVPTCAESGVLGILPGIVGLIQATEAVKFLAGLGSPLTGRLIHCEALSMRFREFKLRRDPACAVCGDHPTITTPIDYAAFCGSADTCTLSAPASHGEMSVEELRTALENPPPAFLLIDVREPWECAIASLHGSLSIPLGELETRLAEISPDREIAIHCKAGGRSSKAVALLKTHGYPQVRNVAGGIDAWSQRIDPNMPSY